MKKLHQTTTRVKQALLKAVLSCNKQGTPYYPKLKDRHPLGTDKVREWERTGLQHDYINDVVPIVFDHPTYLHGCDQGKAWVRTTTPKPKRSLNASGYKLDNAGWPIHPMYRELLQAGAVGGPGAWYQLGPNTAADGILIRQDRGEPEVLFIQRGDNGDWALPGGMQDGDEDLTHTAFRELEEETGIDLTNKTLDSSVVYRGVVADPRSTLHAWPETQALLIVLPDNVAARLVVKAGDDAIAAQWRKVSTLETSKLYGSHGIMLQLALDGMKKKG